MIHQRFRKGSDVILENAVLRPEEGGIVKEIFVESDVAERVVQIPEGTHVNLCGFSIGVCVLEEEHTAEISIPVFHQLLYGIHAREAFHIDIFGIVNALAVIARFGENGFLHIGKESRNVFHFLAAGIFGGLDGVDESVIRDEMARLLIASDDV